MERIRQTSFGRFEREECFYIYLNQSLGCLTDNREVQQFLKCDSSGLIWESTLRGSELHSRNACFSSLVIKGVYMAGSGIDICIADAYFRSDESHAGCMSEVLSASQTTLKITKECNLHPCVVII